MMIKEKVINLRVERDMEGSEKGYEGRREEIKKMMSYCFNLKMYVFQRHTEMLMHL